MNRAEFGISKDALLDGMEHSAIEDYYTFMIDAAILFGANKTMAEQQLYNTLQFEMELAKVRVLSRNIFFERDTFEPLYLICFGKNSNNPHF